LSDILDYQPLNLYLNYKEAAIHTPDVPMIFDDALPAFPSLGLQTTYKKSHEEILKRAYQLAKLGVKKGDKIIIYKSPKFDTYLLAVAASYLAAVPVMVSYHLTAETIDVFVERLENTFILYDEVTAQNVSHVHNLSPVKKISLDLLLNTDLKQVSQEILGPDDIAYMTHTSGTTGIPKLICHSYHSMGWRTKWQKEIFSKIGEKKLVAFHISPVHSRFNIGVSSLMAMSFPMMPFAQSDVSKVSDMITKHQPVALETHPNNFVQWSHMAKKSPHVFNSIKYYHSTFDAINNATMSSFLKASKANNPIFLQVYGQSECGPMILRAHTLESLKDSDARDMGVGLEGLTKARITDKTGQVLPNMTDGHIQFLSKGRALTYYKEDARFEENVYDEWWDSGDYGMIDECGHLYLKDRQVDLIENIDSNLAIEDYLLDSLDFLEEVVIVRGKDKSPQPVISVVPGKEMDWDAWWIQVADLPHLNEPIIKSFDEIPHTATMKVQRLLLEKLLSEK